MLIRGLLPQVSPVQRAFVEKLLAASTFSRQLSAVRETDVLLTRAASLKKTGSGEDDAAAMRVRQSFVIPWPCSNPFI